MFAQIPASPLQDQGMLLKQFGENIGVEQDKRLWYYAEGSRKNVRRFKAMASTCATSSALRP